MTDEKKFDIAMKKIDEAFFEVNQDKNIRKPMAYALYRAWKYFDKNEAPREVKCPYGEEEKR